eukprot:CAMPEP_0177644602 /NCGR_PEP_ID=MMETSP0447-20121125/8779_1 /TAXON_ID=0 /ORGANISM="Stygamoeba regulata, Strain BSH-02190019" /LENGTH=1051 /DNA_ID=CAMNT_0019146981 /DNA_START=13 /DNA_END=3164 /DNA_ORIENTATION=-
MGLKPAVAEAQAGPVLTEEDQKILKFLAHIAERNKTVHRNRAKMMEEVGMSASILDVQQLFSTYKPCASKPTGQKAKGKGKDLAIRVAVVGDEADTCKLLVAKFGEQATPQVATTKEIVFDLGAGRTQSLTVTAQCVTNAATVAEEAASMDAIVLVYSAASPASFRNLLKKFIPLIQDNPTASKLPVVLACHEATDTPDLVMELKQKGIIPVPSISGYRMCEDERCVAMVPFQMASSNTSDAVFLEAAMAVLRDRANAGVTKLPKIKRKIMEVRDSNALVMDLDHVGLSMLPNDFCANIFFLLHLELKNNKLTSFPVELFRLPMLKTLDLSNNAIEAISDDIENMVSLQRLVLEHNKINELPLRSLTKMKRLKDIRLKGNSLSGLPSDLKKMEPNSIIPHCREGFRKGSPVAITITVVAGSNLVVKDRKVGSSDPYCELMLEITDQYRTKVIPKSLTPRWDQTFYLGQFEEDDVVSVTCWDKDMFSSDFMGEFEIALCDYCKIGTYSRTFTLMSRGLNEECGGSIDVVIGVGQPGAAKKGEVTDASKAIKTGISPFGVALSEQMVFMRSVDPKLEVPLFLLQACTELLKSGLDGEGIFRLAGSSSEIKNYKEQLTNGEAPSFNDADANSVADIVKHFLRELPQPLLTFELYDTFIKASETSNTDTLKRALSQLPPANYHVLHVIFYLLYQISINSEHNKMGHENLGLVMGPNLLWKKGDAGIALSSLNTINNIAILLIKQYHEIFTTPPPLNLWPEGFFIQKKYVGHNKSIRTMLILPSINKLWAGDGSGRLYIYDTESLNRECTKDLQQGCISSLCHNEASSEVWVGTQNCLVLLSYNGEEITQISTGCVYSSVVAGGFMWVATDQKILLMGLQSKSVEHSVEMKGSVVTSMVEARGNVWCSCTDRSIRVISANGQQILQTISVRASDLFLLNDMICSLCDEGVSMWKLETLGHFRSVALPTGERASSAFAVGPLLWLCNNFSDLYALDTMNFQEKYRLYNPSQGPNQQLHQDVSPADSKVADVGVQPRPVPECLDHPRVTVHACLAVRR